MKCKVFPNPIDKCPFQHSDKFPTPTAPSPWCKHCLVFQLHHKRQAQIIRQKEDELLRNMCYGCG